MMHQQKTKLAPLREHLHSVGQSLKARGTAPDLNITSIPTLNRKIWGLSRKKLTVIGARPSNHKSGLTLQMCYDISEKHRVILISLEQTVEEAVERLFCNVMSVNNRELLEKGFKEYESMWGEFCAIVQDRQLVISDGMGKTWQELDDMVSELDPKPDLVALDYIQCVRDTHKKKMDAMEDFILHFRHLAIQHNFAALLCSQINRTNTDGTQHPSIVGLKGTGVLEEHADKILLLHWEAHTDHSADMNKFTVKLVKHKSGSTGDIDIRVEPQHYRFSDYEVDIKSTYVEKSLPKEAQEEIKPIMNMFDGSVG